MSSVTLIVEGYLMCSVGGSMSPSGTNGTIGATRASPSLRAIASVVARSTTLCLPATRYGPFCSMPPVATIAVSLPAFKASRTSIQVMSSMKTVSRAGMGRGASGSGRTGSGTGAWVATNASASRTRIGRAIGGLLGEDSVGDDRRAS